MLGRGCRVASFRQLGRCGRCHDHFRRSLYWQGIDDPARWSTANVELDADRLTAHGESWTDSYELTWQLTTVGDWVTDRLEVRVVGLGSNRGSLNRALFLHRSSTGEWSSQTVRSESAVQPDTCGRTDELAPPGIEEPATLTGVLDCDLGFCPLTNTMPMRRLGLQQKSLMDSSEQEMTVAWVQVPSLRVVALRQTYAKQSGHVEYRSVETDFRSQLEIDCDGLVLNYPGLARQAERFAVGA